MRSVRITCIPRRAGADDPLSRRPVCAGASDTGPAGAGDPGGPGQREAADRAVPRARVPRRTAALHVTGRNRWQRTDKHGFRV